MKQIDNRQKQQILMKAQKTFLGGKNPLLQRERERVQGRSAAEKPPENQPGPGPEAGLFETAHRSGPRIGRNDPCPCGSGKKYKKCCLK